MKFLFFSFVLALAACTTQQVSDGIAVACEAAPIILAEASALAKGGAAGPTGAVAVASGLVNASCTAAGQIQLHVNDTLPVTATNSGDSGHWLIQTAQDALAKAKASAAAPVKAKTPPAAAP